MSAHFEAGQTDAGSLKLALGSTPMNYFKPADDGIDKYRELYWRFYFRRDPEWTGGGGNKLTRAMSFGSTTSWAQAMIAHVWSGKSPYEMHLVADPATGTDPVTGEVLTQGYNDFANLRWLGATRGPTLLFDRGYAGRWVCIEVHARLNDPGLANGLMEVWLNEQEEIYKGQMNWVGPFEDYGINAIFLENYWNAGSPVAQSATSTISSSAPNGSDACPAPREPSFSGPTQ